MTHASVPLPSAEQELHRADVTSGQLAAIIRVAIFAALLVAVITAQSADFDHRPLVAATIVYGGGTLAGLVLAWRARFQRWIPFAFIALDVVTLALAILLLGRMMGFATGLAITLPVAGLVIIVLLHASMHYRPALVAFGAVLFVASLLAGSALIDAGVLHVDAPAHDVPEQHLLHFRIFPVAVFALACIILLVTTQRTRTYIRDAFAHASRAAMLSRYFSPEVVEELIRRTADSASFGERVDVAVLFADLQGFTAMAESMDPAELARFLSEFRSRLARPAMAHGGVVDKYIGDAIMVVFGVPKPQPDDGRRALECAMEMVSAIRTWSSERGRIGAAPVSIGIGAHYGSAFAGVLSDGRLLEYTVIGDTVNVASRLADLPKAFGTPLVISAELAQAAGSQFDPGEWKALPPQKLPGHPREVSVYKLESAALDIASPASRSAADT